MTPRVKSGLLAGAVGLLSSALGGILCCFSGPIVALLVGGTAGFFAARAEKVQTRGEGARAGAIPGAIAGPLVLIGHAIGTAGQVALSRQPMFTSDSQLPPEDTLIMALCPGLLALVLAVLGGIAGGFLAAPGAARPVPVPSTKWEWDSVVAALTAMGDQDPAVRQGGIEAIVRIGAPAVDSLIPALGDRNDVYRKAAVEALARIGIPAVGPLIAALGDRDSSKRHGAAEALADIGAPALGPLVAALQDENAHVRLGASKVLEQLDWHAVEPGEKEVYWVARKRWDECVKIGAPAVAPLIAVLRDAAVREEATAALVQIGAPAVAPLITALKDMDLDKRKRAAAILGEIGDTRAVGPLTAALQDLGGPGLPAAVKALRRIGEPVTGPLVAALGDRSEQVRQDAAMALGEIGDTDAVEPLVAALGDSSAGVRESAARALGWIGDAQATEPLIAALGDKDWRVRKAAARALETTGDERATAPLLAALEDKSREVCKVAAFALAEIGDAHVMEPVRACLIQEGYFESLPPEGDGLCSDNECPCPSPGTPIMRGQGFLYIPPEAVEMRRDARTLDALEAKRARAAGRDPITGAFRFATVMQGLYHPILMCRQGAERRGIDLEMAAKDAAFWWKTGLVPLRPTPKAAALPAAAPRAAAKPVREVAPREPDEMLLDRVRQLLDPSSILEREYAGKTVKAFVEAGDVGTETLHHCLRDAFRIRAGTMESLLPVAHGVAQERKDPGLISILEEILREGRHLVVADSLQRLPWMPKLRPEIVGGGKYGWSDGTWMPIARRTAEFLLQLVPQLPPELQAEHAERLSEAIDHHITRWKEVRQKASSTGFVDQEIDYWSSLKGKLLNRLGGSAQDLPASQAGDGP